MAYKDKEIQKAYQREWHKANRKPKAQQGGAITKRNLITKAKDKPCELCGIKYHPNVMQFHHKDPATKVASISCLERRASVKDLLDEIQKCSLLCANCHAEVHAGVKHI
jgi:hypothetical protein